MCVRLCDGVWLEFYFVSITHCKCKELGVGGVVDEVDLNLLSISIAWFQKVTTFFDRWAMKFVLAPQKFTPLLFSCPLRFYLVPPSYIPLH